MSTTTIDVQEAHTHWQEMLGLVLAGNEILVTLAQKPVMRLVPIQRESEPRIAGLHAGMGWVSDDFDAALPDEFWNLQRHVFSDSPPQSPISNH